MKTKTSKQVFTEYPLKIRGKTADGQEVDLGYAEIQTQKKYNKNFVMIWADKYNRTGDLMIDLFFYLISKAKRGWIHRIRDEDLAKEFKVTRKTISNAKRKLHKAGLIKYEAKAIFINPDIAWRGTSPAQKEDCKTEYNNFRGIGDEKRSADGAQDTLDANEST